MKTAFTVEANRLSPAAARLARQLGIAETLRHEDRTWLAEIVGTHARYGYSRIFIQPRVDYRDASPSGRTGIRLWWTLESGHMYELHHGSRLEGRQHRWLTVNTGGDVVDVSEGTVRQWIANS